MGIKFSEAIMGLESDTPVIDPATAKQPAQVNHEPEFEPFLVFSNPLSTVLFSTPAPLSRAGIERKLMNRFFRWMNQCESQPDQYFIEKADRIEGVILKNLSGDNCLKALKLIEDRRPSLLTHLPTAQKWAFHLDQTRDLNEILSPVTLERLVTALVLESYSYGS